MDRIIRAIHSSVPEELWPEILRKIDGPVAADTPADEFEDGDELPPGFRYASDSNDVWLTPQEILAMAEPIAAVE